MLQKVAPPIRPPALQPQSHQSHGSAIHHSALVSEALRCGVKILSLGSIFIWGKAAKGEFALAKTTGDIICSSASLRQIPVFVYKAEEGLPLGSLAGNRGT